MCKRVLAVGLALGLMAAGCTNVQKGTAAGGALGSGVGAVVGHAMTGVGSGPGAIAGLALGAAGGAVAADYYYGSDDTGQLAAAQQTIDDLNNQLRAKDARLADANAAIEREKTQQKALLEAYEKAGSDRQAVVANVTPDVQVTTQGDTVTFTILSSVLFPSGRADLSTKGRSALREAAQAIRAKYAECPVEIRGYTDNEPIKYSHYESNYALSCARAQSVMQYLTGSGGLDASHVTTTGFGDTQPVASNSTSEGRQKNRRAEIVVHMTKVDVASADVLK
jgi:chemotaxis protein MotB